MQVLAWFPAHGMRTAAHIGSLSPIEVSWGGLFIFSHECS